MNKYRSWVILVVMLTVLVGANVAFADVEVVESNQVLQIGESNAEPMYDGEYLRRTNLGYQATLYEAFVNYNPLTPDWSYATGYHLQVGNSLTVSGSSLFKGYSVSINATVARGVVIDFWANRNVKSKLGIFADFNVYHYKIEHVRQGQVINTYYSYVSELVPGSVTNKVVYQ